MDWIRVESREELREALAAPRRRPLWIVKHSTRCGVSSHALSRVERFRAEHGDRDGDWLLIEVPRQRQLADEVAERTGVRHESPQVIAWTGEVAWHASHWKIDESALARAASEVRG